MSEIITNKLTGKTSAGDVDITSEGGAVTMQLQQGLAKAWVNFNGRDTLAVQDSLNYSSVTDNDDGDYTSAYSSNFDNVNYITNGGNFGEKNHGRGTWGLGVGLNSDNSLSLYTSSQVRMYSNYGASASSAGGEYDPTPCHIIHMGDLA